MNTQKLLASFLSAILIALSVAGAREANKETYATIAVPEGLFIEGAQRAVIKAAIGRHWKIVLKKDDQVILNLVHRGYDSTLTFNLEKKQIKLFSDSWTTNKKGEKKKKKDPKGWIENLRKDILVFMNQERSA